MLLPMSIPRSINALRFTSLFGVLCSVYLTLAVFFVFYCDKELVPNPGKNFEDAELFTVSTNLFVTNSKLLYYIVILQWSRLVLPLHHLRLHVSSKYPNDLRRVREEKF